MRTQLIENILIINKRDKIPQFYLLTHHHVIHVQKNKCKNSGHYILMSMKVLMKATKKDTREWNFWIYRKRYCTLRDTASM